MSVPTHSLRITAASADPALLDLPWQTPLEEWPANRLAALPRGISRHVVRFVRMSDAVLAAKEIGESLARREYDLLRMLRRLALPAVEPIGIVTGRHTPDGRPLDPVLLTRHLQFSLPYRALFSQSLRADTATRLIDALAVLLVRLHLGGFYWGDVSLSNTLFRRDAGAFAAYLVDAETGDLHDSLSRGQREHDLDLAATNIAGELMDLAAGGLLDEAMDPIDTSDLIVARYRSLWTELTERYSAGVSAARDLGTTWAALQGKLDDERFNEVAGFLKIQADEARWWRDASLDYFGSLSGLPIPPQYEPPLHPLNFYEALTCPADVTKARCPDVYTP